MMRKWVLAAAAVATIATCALAQRGGGGQISQQCRQQIGQLCGMTRDRDAIGKCLREKASKLSKSCQSEVMARIEANGGGRQAPQTRQARIGGVEYSYGGDATQRLDFWPAPKTAAKPGLVVFIHGGGWSKGDKDSATGTKPAFYNALGYAFASVNYRLVPNASVEQQASDIADAIGRIRREADRLAFDPDNIIVMGHSAGAHLAALVSTNTSYLDNADVPVQSVRATILLDGAGYDIAKHLEGEKTAARRFFYEPAFGDSPEFHRAMSPITHVATPNVGKWLILFSESRDVARSQSEAFGAALKTNGQTVSIQAVPKSTHMSVNDDASVADSFVGTAIAGFLKG
jgi:arylformamidase